MSRRRTGEGKKNTVIKKSWTAPTVDYASDIRSDRYEQQIGAMQKDSLYAYEQSILRAANIDATFPTQFKPIIAPGKLMRQEQELVYLERASIDALSFVPGYNVRREIYRASKIAKRDPNLCTKLAKKPPNPVDPSNSVLVKVATHRPLPFGPKKWQEEGLPLPKITSSGGTPQPLLTLKANNARTDSKFAIVMDDGGPALLPQDLVKDGVVVAKCSSGPNGVLTSFSDADGEFGRRRINLFDELEGGDGDTRTKLLLEAYLNFRDGNKQAIFRQTVGHMREHVTKNYAAATDYYIKTVGLLEKAANLPPDRFEDTIGVASFCQTWCGYPGEYTPEFSIESPHFQNRFYIKSITNGLDITDPEFKAYKLAVELYSVKMASMGYTKKFVHLDDLLMDLEE
jgi:hypothetical protein